LLWVGNGTKIKRKNMMKNYKNTYQNTLIASGNNIKELQRETIKNFYLGRGYYFQKYLEHRKHQSNQMKALPNLFGLKNHS